MSTPPYQLNTEWLRRQLDPFPARKLLLDFDGTLAPFAVDRMSVNIYPDVLPVLERLNNNPRTRPTIISGRTIADLERLIPLTPLPELWGSHGLERRHADGSRADRPLTSAFLTGFHEIAQWAGTALPAEAVEHKATGIAFHWRGREAVEAAAMRERIDTEWSHHLEAFDMVCHEFDGGVELRFEKGTKADAVRVIRDESGPEVLLAYLGDDWTDEDAFAALNPPSLAVLVRPERRPTAAQLWLKPPEELATFLTIWGEFGDV